MSEPVGTVLQYAEDHEKVQHFSAQVTVARVLDALTRTDMNHRSAAAVIITQNGRATEKPLSLVVPYDIPQLYSAIALTS